MMGINTTDEGVVCMSLARQARLKKGYSLQQAAKMIDIPAGYLSQIENGKRQISYERAQRIANLYNAKVEDLFEATRFARRIR